MPTQHRRTIAAAAMLTLTACTTTTPGTYEPFTDVTPDRSPYFIALEHTDLAVSQGDQRLYNLGVGVCRNLDGGNTITQEITGLTGDAGLAASDAGALVGSAVANLCPHHTDLIEEGS